MNLQKKKRGFLFLVVVLIGLTIGVIFYGRYQTEKVEQEKETSIERESRQAEQLPDQLPEPADTDFVKITDYIPDIVVDLKYAQQIILPVRSSTILRMPICAMEQ